MRRASAMARRGMALVWAVIILALLTTLTGAVIGQVKATRRQLDRRVYQLQAEWLARAGVELAAGRLLTQPAGYTGETVALVDGAQVRVEVKSDPKTPDIWLVTSVAHYPKDSPEGMSSSASRRFRRKVEKEQVRLEVVAEPTP